MADAGVDSLELDFYCNDDDFWRTASQVLQQQWKEINVDIKITTSRNSAFWAALGEGRGRHLRPPTGTRWRPRPRRRHGNVFTSTAGSNYSGYSNPEVDDLVARSMASRTTEASNELLAQGGEADLPTTLPGSSSGA